MKNLILIISVICVVNIAKSQNSQLIDVNNVKTIILNEEITSHLIFNEQIKYVDMPKIVVGDLPIKNILRIKPHFEADSLKREHLGLLTVVTERNSYVFNLVLTEKKETVTARYQVGKEESYSYLNPNVRLTNEEINKLANKMLASERNFFGVSSYNAKMRIRLNNIYVVDKFFFFDISVYNRTNIPYDIEHFKFTIDDKKKTKATNFQSLEIKPIFSLNNDKDFKKNYRNIFVFKKFTFPNAKTLTIELAEKQISGRVIYLQIDYRDVLNADSFNLYNY